MGSLGASWQAAIDGAAAMPHITVECSPRRGEARYNPFHPSLARTDHERTLDTPSTGSPPLFVKPPEDRLESWKEIAAYLKRDVSTVQRWEKREGMPVRRHLHNK